MPTPELNDPDFTAYARQGDEAAFRRIVNAHLGLVRGAALRTLGVCPHLVDDVTQSVFLRLAKKASSLPGDLNVSVWLHQQAVWISRDVVKSEIRRKKREVSAHDISEDVFIPDPSVNPEVSRLLDESLLDLPQRDREVVLMRYFQNLSFQQVGEVLGMSAGTAQKRAERAVEKLRLRLRALVKSPVTHASLVTLLMLEGKAHAATPPLLASSIATQALASKSGALSTLVTLMASSKSIFIGAVAGGLLAAAPMLASTFSNAPRTGHGNHVNSESSGAPAAVKAGVFTIPAPAETPSSLLEQVKRILSEPDTERTRARLEVYLAQLDSSQLANLFREADTHGSSTLALRLMLPLVKCWGAVDGEAAMLACEATKLFVNENVLGSYTLMETAYEAWLGSNYEEASQWLMQNQDRTGLSRVRGDLVSLVSRSMATKSPEQFVAWARQIQDDDLLGSAIKGASGSFAEQRALGGQSDFWKFFELLRSQNDPAFTRRSLVSLLDNGSGLIGEEGRMAKEVALMPQSGDLMWKLLEHNSSNTLQGLAEVYSHQEMETLVSDAISSLTMSEACSRTTMQEGENPAEIAKYLPPSRRQELVARMVSLTTPPADLENVSWDISKSALQWTALIEDEDQRAVQTDKILQSVPERWKKDQLLRKVAPTLPADMRRKVELAIEVP